MTLKTEILATPDYMLLKSTEDAKENLRTAYELALSHDNKPVDMKEQPDDMFHRTGRFIWAVGDALTEIKEEAYKNMGLIGGAAGSASLADLQYLSEGDAAIVMDIAFAEKEIQVFKKDCVNALIAWAARKA